MAKQLKCADVDPKMRGCSFVAEGRDEAEVMKKAADHAKSAHGMAVIPPDVERKVRAAIRDTGGSRDVAGRDVKLGTSKLG